MTARAGPQSGALMHGVGPAPQDSLPASQQLAALVSRVSMRDQAAFKQLYDATARCLLGIVVRMLRERAWAEDVLQEVYVAVWNTAPNYSPALGQPMTWLMAIARHKALDALRGTRTERQHRVRPTARGEGGDDDDGMADIVDDRVGPLEQLVQAIESKHLRHCLQRLEPVQRQAIALAFYDGLTHAELAVHLHQPLGTVKAWVRRGLERLRPCLER